MGYFVRHRSAWGRPSKWSLWTECSAEDYTEFCKIIATGEADAGRFYEARILCDAPPTSVNALPVAWEMRYWNSGHNMWHDRGEHHSRATRRMSVQHATDNDYEFRVLYDAPPAPAVPMTCKGMLIVGAPCWNARIRILGAAGFGVIGYPAAILITDISAWKSGRITLDG
ncbi:hypothetical protein M8494_19755 [Serratia ureilytica]